jgi:hypothetical protein
MILPRLASGSALERLPFLVRLDHLTGGVGQGQVATSLHNLQFEQLEPTLTRTAALQSPPRVQEHRCSRHMEGGEASSLKIDAKLLFASR